MACRRCDRLFNARSIRARPVPASIAFRSACRCAVPIVLVLSRLRRYSYSYSNPMLTGRCYGVSRLAKGGGRSYSTFRPSASASTSTASLSTSTILRGRSMRGAAWAKQRVRQRRLAAVTGSGRRQDCASAAREWPAFSLARFPCSRICAVEKLRGRLRSGILAVRESNPRRDRMPLQATRQRNRVRATLAGRPPHTT